MTEIAPWQHLWPVRSLPARRPLDFDLSPDAATRERIAADLGLLDLPALRFSGTLQAVTRDEVVLQGRLVARVVQPCSVTLAPVPAAIDEPVRRRFLADWQEPEGDEVELPEDVDVELLGQAIDGGAIALEALSLALPPWPRAPGADLAPTAAAPPGAAPLTDADLRPFAGLAALKGRLKDPGTDGGTQT